MLRKIAMGCGNLPGYGPHPGTAMVISLIAVTTAAGMIKGGWLMGLGGFCLSAAMYGTIYLWGAYMRADSYLRGQRGKKL